MVKGFWSRLKQPFIGLSPMDGVTDASFRMMVARHGHPDLIISEFTSADGLRAGAIKLLDDFIYSPLERPVVGQLFSSDPQALYLGALVVCALGFDGIDINMGCPSRQVAQHGAGAALILDPLKAQDLIRAAQKAAMDWMDGINLDSTELPEAIRQEIKKRTPENNRRQLLPVSVKTRIGYQQNSIKEWIPALLEARPAAISVHGRTLKQMYSGQADWEAIALAVRLAEKSQTYILGNGDVRSKKAAAQLAQKHGVNGVLIGRAALGNPWLFRGKEAGLPERLSAIQEHAEILLNLFPERDFSIKAKKHLLPYLRDFPGAKELRLRLLRANTAEEVFALVKAA